MTAFDYELWLTSVNDLAARFVSGFAEKFGYPPDENKARPAFGPLPDGVMQLPAPLVEFYRHVAEVSLPDVHIGYFVSMAQATVNGRDGRLPVRIEGAASIDVVTFGSDGGGTYFALGLPDGAPVYRMPPSAVDREGVYDNRDSRVQVVAATLPEFLTKLHNLLVSEIRQ
ncbi:SMI1/KNR4 family protein [Saccharothrix sp. NRRL B-16314]|uniref:SMI1/KNR4 family protein n=1 Tax=Saccharothrix sp. NRRL B-16314 TaxID=1463825 RepID=UPI0012DEF094|nr:SMI1/KNR4 family protein [Saccharothrix sp. NRRL B-16314]